MAEEVAQAQPTPAEQFEADYDIATEIQASSDRAPESELPQTPAAELVKIKHPAYLINMARKSGFSDEEIQSIPSEHLGLMVERIQERARELAEQPRQQPREQARAPVPVPEPEEDIDLKSLGIAEESFDPEFVKAMKAMAKAPLKKVKELEQKLAQSEAQHQARAQEEVNRQIEKLFASDSDEWKVMFGKGNATQVKQNNPKGFSERMKVVTRMDLLMKTEGLDLAEAYEEAKAIVYRHLPKKAKVPEPKVDEELEQRKKDWEEGTVAQPTQRRAQAQPDGRQKAVENVSKILKQRQAPEQTNAEANGHATHADFLE